MLCPADVYVCDGDVAVSELEVSIPTPEEMLAELKDMRADREIGAQLLDAARARADQDTAAIRELTADRDRWQSAAENVRGELWRQVDGLRAESGQQRDQIAQLSLALASLLEAIVGTTPSDDADAAIVPSNIDSAATPVPVAEAEAPQSPAPIDVPAVVPDVPASDVTMPAVVPDVATVSAPAPSPAPAVVLAPYVPANEPRHPHLEPKPAAPQYVPDPDHDRVGVLTELMAVAVDSVSETAAGGSSADRAAGDDSLPNAPSGMTILPAAEPAPEKRSRRARRSG
jgi:hypothetical protein